MTRRLRTTLTLVTTLLATALLTLPAAAATEGEAETGFGSGEWDGLILTVIAGALLGILVFAVSDPGGIPRADAHH